MKRIYNSKISVKLFIITAFTFTSLLICSLLAQAYYFHQSYSVYQTSNPAKYKDLLKELNKTDMSSASVSKVLIKYKEKYDIEAAIFLRDTQTLKFQPEALTDYPTNRLEAAIRYYLTNISPTLAKYENNFVNEYIIEGRSYSLAATTYLNGGEVLFVMYPTETLITPGLIDQYYVYVFVIGILVSLLLSYAFSLMISRPLVKINKTAKDIAELNFNEKLSPISDDELGQLSNSLNTLSEKLDSTLSKLKAANIKLEADIEKERELEKVRKEFVANASHELKTPLSIVKCYGEALNDKVREDKKEHYISQIIQQTDKMSKLIEDMLELSNIEGGQYRLQISDFDLAMLTKSILESLRFLADEKKLHFLYDFSSPAVVIQADRMKISQVITNFANNAIRHTPQNGSIFVRISESTGTVKFEIENEGANIAQGKLNKVWGRFYRAEGVRDKNTGGTGLGLAISEKILQAHKMRYGVENTNKGVKFYFKSVSNN